MSTSSGSSSANSRLTDGGIGSYVSSQSSTFSDDPEARARNESRINQGLNNQYREVCRISREIRESGAIIDQTRMEAERMLLMEILKTKLLGRQLDQQQYVNNRLHLCRIGTVKISNVKAQERDNLRNKAESYYLCALIEGSTPFLSEICQADSEGFVHFNIDHTFLQQPVDFEIRLRIYVLTKKTQKSSTMCSCWRNTNNDDERETNKARTSSLFKLEKEFKILIADVNKSSKVTSNASSLNFQKFFFDIVGKVDVSSFSVDGWLDVSKNGLFFDQRYCVLRGTMLSCFNQPIYDCYPGPTPKEGLVIDLNYCIRVRLAGPREVARRNVLVLQMDQMYSGQSFTYYLATNSWNVCTTWLILEKIVATLQRWKEVECSIDSGLSKP